MPTVNKPQIECVYSTQFSVYALYSQQEKHSPDNIIIHMAPFVPILLTPVFGHEHKLVAEVENENDEGPVLTSSTPARPAAAPGRRR